MNGQFFGNSEYEVDGITDTAYGFSGFQIIVPNQDSVGEMKITTAAFDPEFGSSAGMVAQYVTKSGTNELHGSAFWFNRNAFSFAADPFTEKLPGTGPDGTGTGPAAFNWNQYGGSLGGPVVKNRVFWFADYQAMPARQGASLTATVPNDSWRNGDFSGQPGNPIFDPASGDSEGLGRTQFPNDTIPQTRFNPVATNLLGLLPRANLNQNTQTNYAGSGKVESDANQFDARVDAALSDSDTAFVRYTIADVFLFNPPLFGIEAGGQALGGLSPQTGDFLSQHLAANYTHTFGPTLLTEVRGGFSRFKLDGFQADAGLNTNDKVGIPNINTDDILTQGLAGIDVFGPVGPWFMGIRSGVGIPRIDRTTTLQFVNNWTKISGGHQFRWGADVRRNIFDFIATNASSRGNFQFSETITGADEVPGSGLGTATFLLGMPSRFDRALFEGFTKEREWRTSFYWQDTWRATPKLTVNYGARWDYLGPATSPKEGGLANFDPGSGDILLSSLGDVSGTANVKSEWGNISPRLGLAYKLTQKTVIRAGFGRSYFASNYGGLFFHLTSFFPIAAQQTIPQDNQRFPIFPIEQGPPAGRTPEFPSSGRLPAPPGELLKHRPFDHPNEYLDSWNFTIEHQLAQDWKVSVAYVGNVGRHLWWPHNMNAAPASPDPNLNARRQLFPKFGLSQPVTNGCNCANSSYNALQFVVEKRFGAGYSLNSAFTWAKALDGQLGGFGWGDQSINPHDRSGTYGISPYNRAAVWVLSHSWELPFGTGRKYGSDAHPAAKAILGGWQFHGVTTLESGFALSPTSSGATLNGDFGQRPNRIGDHKLSNPTRDRWFDASAFTAPAFGTWGNAGRGIMRGPSLFVADWSFWKEVPIGEQFRLQIRWENFNLFNHTNLGPPVTAVDAANAGQITALAGSTSVNPVTVPMRRMQLGLRLTW